jgi:hypothetical protein
MHRGQLNDALEARPSCRPARVAPTLVVATSSPTSLHLAAVGASRRDARAAHGEGDGKAIQPAPGSCAASSSVRVARVLLAGGGPRRDGRAGALVGWWRPWLRPWRSAGRVPCGVGGVL